MIVFIGLVFPKILAVELSIFVNIVIFYGLYGSFSKKLFKNTKLMKNESWSIDIFRKTTFKNDYLQVLKIKTNKKSFMYV